MLSIGFRKCVFYPLKVIYKWNESTWLAWSIRNPNGTIYFHFISLSQFLKINSTHQHKSKCEHFWNPLHFYPILLKPSFWYLINLSKRHALLSFWLFIIFNIPRKATQLFTISIECSKLCFIMEERMGRINWVKRTIGALGKLFLLLELFLEFRFRCQWELLDRQD